MRTIVTQVDPRSDDDIITISNRLDFTRNSLVDDGTLWILATDTDEPQGFPWRLAFELRNRGWWLRQDIVSSVPRWGIHHYYFMLANNAQYYYDQTAIKETANTKTTDKTKIKFGGNKYGDNPEYIIHSGKIWQPTGFRNKRSVWSVAADTIVEEFAQVAEFAILAGSEQGDTITDPFATWQITESVATKLNRNFRREK